MQYQKQHSHIMGEGLLPSGLLWLVRSFWLATERYRKLDWMNFLWPGNLLPYGLTYGRVDQSTWYSLASIFFSKAGPVATFSYAIFVALSYLRFHQTALSVFPPERQQGIAVTAPNGRNI